jgi:hypothetical protein
MNLVKAAKSRETQIVHVGSSFRQDVRHLLFQRNPLDGKISQKNNGSKTPIIN